jgi:hypothetical protein
MGQVPAELTAILREIERALDAKLYYLAIAVTLSIPDICACLECDPEKPIWATKDKYETWCTANLVTHFTNLTAEDLFRLRGGVLHQGHFGHAKARYDRIIFITPESQFQAHDAIIAVAPGVKVGGVDVEKLRLSGQLLHLNVASFCKSIMDAARTWAISKAGDPNVQQNLPNLVRYRPDGLPPFSVGIPTIA